MQGEIAADDYRFKLGGFEVATIMDSKVIRERAHAQFSAVRRRGGSEGAGGRQPRRCQPL